MHRYSGSLFLLCVVLFFVTSVLPARSQSFRLNQDNEKSVSVSMLRPNFDNTAVARFLSMALIVSGYMPVSDRVDLRLEVPLSQYGIQESGKMEMALGNPYVGFKYTSATPGLSGELGLRVPLSSDATGLRSGILSDISQWGAFSEDVLSMQAGVSYTHPFSSNLEMDIRGGTDFWVYASGDAKSSVDWFYNYGTKLWYSTSRLRLGSGIAGRALVSPYVRLNGQLQTHGHTAHQASFSAVGMFRRIQPGLHLLLPIDDGLTYSTSYALGITLTVPLGANSAL